VRNLAVQSAITRSCLHLCDITGTTFTCYTIPLTVALVGRPVGSCVPFLATCRKVEVHQALSRDWIFGCSRHTGATPTSAARLSSSHTVLVSQGAVICAVDAWDRTVTVTAEAIGGQPRKAVLA
jgi:hypothetical protein